MRFFYFLILINFIASHIHKQNDLYHTKKKKTNLISKLHHIIIIICKKKKQFFIYCNQILIILWFNVAFQEKRFLNWTNKNQRVKTGKLFFNVFIWNKKKMHFLTKKQKFLFIIIIIGFFIKTKIWLPILLIDFFTHTHTPIIFIVFYPYTMISIMDLSFCVCVWFGRNYFLFFFCFFLIKWWWWWICIFPCITDTHTLFQFLFYFNFQFLLSISHIVLINNLFIFY